MTVAAKKSIKEKIITFSQQSIKNKIKDIREIKQSGSDRLYFRVEDIENKTYIAAYNSNITENKTFLYYTEVFLQTNINVPIIYAVSNDYEMYLLQDLGDNNLLDYLHTERKNEEIPQTIEILYKKSIAFLIRMQIQVHKNLNYSKAFSISEFNADSILFDLNYFKYYFLNLKKIKYNESILNSEFVNFASELEKSSQKFFMFRDFQARNIMIVDEEPFFIDYQGGRKGALQYDLASLLYQAKAKLPEEFRTKMLYYYISLLKHELSFDEDLFIKQYYKFVFLRVLQTLGAYGYRGLIERKSHFLTSIPDALENLNFLIYQLGIADSYSELKNACISFFNKTTVHEKKYNGLTISINSFSYKKGIPDDNSDNGGGFVFDCRGIHNPGRYEEYKNKTGKEKEVIDFFKKNTKIDDFANNAFNIVSYNIEDYLSRNFSSLMISFGCTGGQHRSVYCAEKLAIMISEKYKVRILLTHIEQNECKII